MHGKPQQAYFLLTWKRLTARGWPGILRGTQWEQQVNWTSSPRFAWFQARLMGPYEKRCQVPRTQANTRTRITPPSPEHTFPASLPASAAPKEGPWLEGLTRRPHPILSLLTFQAQKHLCCLFFLQCFPYFTGQITQAIKLISKACKGNNI